MKMLLFLFQIWVFEIKFLNSSLFTHIKLNLITIQVKSMTTFLSSVNGVVVEDILVRHKKKEKEKENKPEDGWEDSEECIYYHNLKHIHFVFHRF